MEQKKKVVVVIITVSVILIGMAGYLYYSQNTEKGKGRQTASNITSEGEDISESINNPDMDTEEKSSATKKESVTEGLSQESSTTTEKRLNTPLPDNYEWDEEQWGEPPRIVYDFAENQEKFDLIVSEVDSLISVEEGFTTKISMDGLYYNSKHKNIENELSDKFKQNAIYLFNYTNFYQITKTVGGHWFMEYDQAEDRGRYIYYMTYVPNITEEQAWDEGYMKVVADWYFGVIPLI